MNAELIEAAAKRMAVGDLGDAVWLGMTVAERDTHRMRAAMLAPIIAEVEAAARADEQAAVAPLLAAIDAWDQSGDAFEEQVLIDTALNYRRAAAIRAQKEPSA